MMAIPVVMESPAIDAEDDADMKSAIKTKKALEGISTNTLKLRDRTTPSRKVSRIACVISIGPKATLSRKTLI